MNNKNSESYKTIGEVAKILGSISKKKNTNTNPYNQILGKRI